MKDLLTVAMTTIDRNELCKSAISRLRTLFPDLVILVADQNDPTLDMKQFYEKHSVDVHYVGHDIGLSAARNRMLELVDTKYVLLCDDDLVEMSIDEVRRSVGFMEERSDVLAVGGRASKLRRQGDCSIESVNPDFDYFILGEGERGYISLLSAHKLELQKATRLDGGFYIADVVENFVIFDVQKFRKLGLGWDERIKIKNEHLDFYLSLKANGSRNGYKVVYNPRLVVSEIDGMEDVVNITYKSKRTRNDYTSIYCNKWGLNQEFHVGKWINLFNGTRYVSIPWKERRAYALGQLERYQEAGRESALRWCSYRVDEAKLTFMATTMARYEVAESFVLSIRRFFPNASILLGVQADSVGHDMEELSCRYGVDVVCLGADIGLSKARNEMVGRVETEYFVLCDDDFVIDDQFLLNNPLRVLEENPGIGVVGGYYRDVIYTPDINFKQALDRQFTMRFEYEPITKTLVRIPFNYIPFDKAFDEDTRCVPVDCVNNLAVFRRSIFEDPNIRWDERMKISGEHIDFYFNIFRVGGVGIVYDPSFSVLHNRRQNMEYVKYRSRRDGITLFYDKWEVENEVDFDFGLKKIPNGIDKWVDI